MAADDTEQIKKIPRAVGDVDRCAEEQWRAPAGRMLERVMEVGTDA